MIYHDILQGFRQNPVVMGRTCHTASTALTAMAGFGPATITVNCARVGFAELLLSGILTHFIMCTLLIHTITCCLLKSTMNNVKSISQKAKKSLPRIIAYLPSTVKNSYGQTLLYALISPGQLVLKTNREAGSHNNHNCGNRNQDLNLSC